MTAPTDRDELTEKQRQDLERGIESAKGNPPVDRGSFAQYADDKQAPGEVEGWLELPSGALMAGNTEAFRISLPVLRALLAHHGLYIVGAEDVQKLAQVRTILDEEIQPHAVRAWDAVRRIMPLFKPEYGEVLSPAELARRAGKERG